MKTYSVGRREFAQEEKPVDIDTITEGFATGKNGKRALREKLCFEYGIPMLNGTYPVIAGTTYNIVKKGDRLILKPW